MFSQNLSQRLGLRLHPRLHPRRKRQFLRQPQGWRGIGGVSPLLNPSIQVVQSGTSERVGWHVATYVAAVARRPTRGNARLARLPAHSAWAATSHEGSPPPRPHNIPLPSNPNTRPCRPGAASKVESKLVEYMVARKTGNEKICHGAAHPDQPQAHHQALRSARHSCTPLSYAGRGENNGLQG